MSEKINLLESTVATRFLAIATSLVDSRQFKGSLLADVSLTVNGIEVPFAATFAKVEDEWAAMVREQASLQALDLVTEAGLEDAMHRLRSARMDIARAFTKIREKCPETTEHVG